MKKIWIMTVNGKAQIAFNDYAKAIGHFSVKKKEIKKLAISGDMTVETIGNNFFYLISNERKNINKFELTWIRII